MASSSAVAAPAIASITFVASAEVIAVAAATVIVISVSAATVSTTVVADAGEEHLEGHLCLQ
ncbi:hypothetical protein [Streptomyces sp. NPDC059080]|uniref:hypothetical protein n=1 Tax=Streptomyces sp. NPDC059080 TaxID=3346718 RepID=UPI0036900C83